MKELYTIKQGPKEPIKHFETWIGYAMMRLAVAFLHAMPAVQAEETRKTHFLIELCPNLKSALAWEMCLDVGRWQMTYEEIKDAARQVEQREDPSMSNDPFVWDNAAPPHRMMDIRIRVGNLNVIKVAPNMGVTHVP